jgi:predicted ATPase
LPATPALRREEINLQVALITPLIHVKGYSAPATKAAVERARLLIEQAEAIGEHLEDLQLLFTVLYGSAIAHYTAINGDALHELSSRFLSLAQRQGATAPLMLGHRLMGHALMLTGNIGESRAHYDQSLALYDPAKHRALATQIGGQDARMAVLAHRGQALWLLGYPEGALADADRALGDAREVGNAATLMYALSFASRIHRDCGEYAAAKALIDELVALADEKASTYWKASGTLGRSFFALTGKASNAVQVISSAMSAYMATGHTVFKPTWLSFMAKAYADNGQFKDAWRCIGETISTIDTTKERWFEAEANRIAGEIALMPPERDAANAEAYFQRALAAARQQQAKSWELRAATSLARLWRDQGKVKQARELVSPVYGWFTEGFDTRDLKEAKALLEEFTA